ncbi:MAG: hypothetical protein RL698_3127 [Pseudomonadota bacterium]
MDRRRFLGRTGLLAAGMTFGPGLFSNRLVRQALAARSDRYLISLVLDGGNDGLNTITPIADGSGTLRSDYEKARVAGSGGIRLLPDGTHPLLPLAVGGLSGDDPNTGAALGMHPGLSGIVPGAIEASGDAGFGGLHELYRAGRVAVIQGCGFPDYNLSHDEARRVFHSANPRGLAAFASTGWLGRTVAHPTYAFGSTDVPALNVRDSVGGDFRATGTSVAAARRLSDFTMPRDVSAYSSDNAAKLAAIEALYGVASTRPGAWRALGDSGTATFGCMDYYPAASRLYLADRAAWSAGYDRMGLGTGRDLREVAKAIYARESGDTRIKSFAFRVDNGGYDTHSDQGGGDPTGQHWSLHAEVAASLKHFFDDLDDMGSGVADRVTVLVWSEFSRRVRQNETGTDHGSQGPVFVVGGGVSGGVYGNHPNIAESDLGSDGNTRYRQGANDFRSTDVRDVYGTVLTRWLGLSAATVLDPTSGILRLDDGPADTRWTVQDFDLRRGSDGAPLFRV